MLIIASGSLAIHAIFIRATRWWAWLSHNQYNGLQCILTFSMLLPAKQPPLLCVSLIACSMPKTKVSTRGRASRVTTRASATKSSARNMSPQQDRVSPSLVPAAPANVVFPPPPQDVPTSNFNLDPQLIANMVFKQMKDQGYIVKDTHQPPLAHSSTRDCNAALSDQGDPAAQSFGASAQPRIEHYNQHLPLQPNIATSSLAQSITLQAHAAANQQNIPTSLPVDSLPPLQPSALNGLPPQQPQQPSTLNVPPPQQQPSALNSALAALVQPGEQQHSTSSPSTSAFSAVRISAPLGSNLSQQFKFQIWAGNFIDMAHILQPPLDPNNPPKQNQNLNLSQWSSAFHTYISVMAEKFPFMAPCMLKHMDTVQKLSTNFGQVAWRHYDTHFRTAMVHNKQMQWGVTELEIYTEATLLAFQLNANRPAQPQQPRYNTNRQPQTSPFPHGTCWAFQRLGRCNIPNCRFPTTHHCLRCNGKHQTSACRGGRRPQQHRQTKTANSHASTHQ